MIIIRTYRDDNDKVFLDYGVDENRQIIILPPEELNCDAQGIKYDSEKQIYYIP